MRKRVFRRTAEVEISHRIRTVWSGPSLSITESLDIIECFNGKKMPGWYFAHVQDDVNPHLLHMFGGTMSLAAAHI